MSGDADLRSKLYLSLHEARLLDARAAVQAGLQINGLAVTAMLAFLASISPKVGASHAGHVPFDFVRSLGGFGFGVFSAALTAVCGYIANHGYAEAESPFTTADDRRWRAGLRAVVAHYIGYGGAALMLFGFLFGVGFAMAGLAKL